MTENMNETQVDITALTDAELDDIVGGTRVVGLGCI